MLGMRKAIWLVIALFAVPLGAVAGGESVTPDFSSEKDRISYASGVEAARNFKREGVEFDPVLFQRGMQDGLSGNRLLIPEHDLKKIMNEFQVKVRQAMAASHKAAAEENRRKAAAFLDGNKDREGIRVLPDGVQIKVLASGSGERRPVEGERVQVEYRGTLLDGSEFDATTPGKPAVLEVARVIPGWKEALKQMTVGSHWQLFIPPALAYGERGVGNDIGPNELLVFDVALVAIQ